MQARLPCFLCLQAKAHCVGGTPCERCIANGVPQMCVSANTKRRHPERSDSDEFLEDDRGRVQDIDDEMYPNSRVLNRNRNEFSPIRSRGRTRNNNVTQKQFARLFEEMDQLKQENYRLNKEIVAIRHQNKHIESVLSMIIPILSNISIQNPQPQLTDNQSAIALPNSIVREPDIVYDITANPIIIHSSERFCEALGYTPSELKTIPLNKLFASDHQEMLNAFASLQNQKRITVVQRYYTKTNSIRKSKDIHNLFVTNNRIFDLVKSDFFPFNNRVIEMISHSPNVAVKNGTNENEYLFKTDINEAIQNSIPSNANSFGNDYFNFNPFVNNTTRLFSNKSIENQPKQTQTNPIMTHASPTVYSPPLNDENQQNNFFKQNNFNQNEANLSSLIRSSSLSLGNSSSIENHSDSSPNLVSNFALRVNPSINDGLKEKQIELEKQQINLLRQKFDETSISDDVYNNLETQTKNQYLQTQTQSQNPQSFPTQNNLPSPFKQQNRKVMNLVENEKNSISQLDSNQKHYSNVSDFQRINLPSDEPVRLESRKRRKKVYHPNTLSPNVVNAITNILNRSAQDNQTHNANNASKDNTHFFPTNNEEIIQNQYQFQQPNFFPQQPSFNQMPQIQSPSIATGASNDVSGQLPQEEYYFSMPMSGKYSDQPELGFTEPNEYDLQTFTSFDPFTPFSQNENTGTNESSFVNSFIQDNNN